MAVIDQYIHCVNEFIRIVIGSLEIDEINILSPQVTAEAKRLIQKYKIDFIDCFQIVTIPKRKVLFSWPEIEIVADYCGQRPSEGGA